MTRGRLARPDGNTNYQDNEKQKFYHALAKSAIITLLLWIAFIVNDAFGLQWNNYGVAPRELSGLVGIITMPFLHADLNHLFSNTFPLFFLSFGLFYFFPNRANLILIMMSVLTGIFTWSIGMQGIHIGASGVVYALAFFMITISILKQNKNMMAYTLIIIFLYGSIIWGFFPSLFPDQHISWEGHLSGAITGVILAFFYRKEGPITKKYFEDEEEDDENEQEEEEHEAYWKIQYA